MKIVRTLSEGNKVFTPDSGTTVYINYSYALNILEVQYTGSTKIYHYKEVKPELWEEYKSVIESGGSSGVFVNKKIKPFFEVEEIA